MMDRVNSQADKVDAWLGKSSENSDRAIRLIREIGAHDGPGRFVRKRLHHWTTDEEDNLLNDFENLVARLPTGESKRAWNGINDIFHRPYWQRMWIVQEIVLARKVRFHCGAESFGMRELENLQLFHLASQNQSSAPQGS